MITASVDGCILKAVARKPVNKPPLSKVFMKNLQVSGHPPDHEQLLGILLSEHG